MTVRYFRDDEHHWWAEAAAWTGTASTLAHLRTLAREAMGFTHGGQYRTAAYFELGDSSPAVKFHGPRATEEFHPVEAPTSV